ncbi:bifunctional metallophosphatase/5'-nucleotidase [Aeromonas simiae]|uniref:bifunctional metallophosphatase/5'-nucleotidase n=1 Tax=Aeromonas simiae TaxID=218936 RepID=UPI0005A82BD2|nr:bifunctional UDP-sugar hydrolase/5'-nucleotidase [Aeromonas simiae]
MPVALHLAHMSDCHSHFDGAPLRLLTPDGQSVMRECGGYPRIATRIAQLRAEAQACATPHLFLHAGDTFQGSLYFNRFKERANATLLGQLAPDAMVIGNHEFDLGNEALRDFIRTVPFPVLAANLDNRHEPSEAQAPLRGLPNLFDAERPWLEKNLGGTRFALLGITLSQMADIANPDPHTRFLPVEETLAQILAAIQGAGIRHIILLSHLGIEQDKKLAERFPQLSLIVGGHTHSLLGDLSHLGISHSEPYPLWHAGVPLFHAGHSAQTLGVCRLRFDDTGRVIEVDGRTEWLLWEAVAELPTLTAVAPEPTLEQHLAHHYRPVLSQMASHSIATLPAPLHHQRLPDAQHPHGSELAPLVAEAMRWSTREQVGRVDFALHNAGGVRCSLEAGPITEADIAGRLLPFAIPLILYEVYGQELIDALEGAINNATDNGVVGNGSGSFPYVAGLDYRYDADAPLGKRITRLRWEAAPGQWESVAPQACYRGVSSAYTAAGKEGYMALRRTLSHPRRELGLTLADAFVRWARHQGSLTARSPLGHYQPRRA